MPGGVRGAGEGDPSLSGSFGAELSASLGSPMRPESVSPEASVGWNSSVATAGAPGPCAGAELKLSSASIERMLMLSSASIMPRDTGLLAPC